LNLEAFPSNRRFAPTGFWESLTNYPAAARSPSTAPVKAKLQNQNRLSQHPHDTPDHQFLKKEERESGKKGEEQGVGDLDKRHPVSRKIREGHGLPSLVAEDNQESGRQGGGDGVAKEGRKGKGKTARISSEQVEDRGQVDLPGTEEFPGG
jgi:hypothetical protein